MSLTKENKGIKKKIIVSIFAIGLIVLLLVLSLVSIIGKSALKKTIGANFKELAEVTSENIEDLINAHIETSRLMSISSLILSSVEESNQFYEDQSDVEIKNRIAEIEDRWLHAQGMNVYLMEVMTNKATLYLKDFVEKEREKGMHQSILITNEKGAVVAASKKPDHYYYGNEKWWRSAYNEGKGRLFISGIELNKETNSYTFNISTPILKDGKVVGIFMMLHNVDVFFKSVTSTKVGETDHIMIADSEGKIIFCPVAPAETHTMEAGLSKEIFKDQSTGWISTKMDVHHKGKESITGFAPLKATFSLGEENFGGKNWYIITSQDPYETYAPVYKLIKFIALIGLIGAVILSSFGFIAAERLVRPIRELQKGTDLIGSGDLDYRINIKTGDEIEDLAGKFNEMALKIKIFYIKLDEKVKERTRELEHRNQELHLLYEMATILNSSSGIDEIVRETSKKMVEIMKSDGGLLWMIDQQTGKTSIVAANGLPSDYSQKEEVVKLINNIGAQIVQSGKFWESNNITVDDRVMDIGYSSNDYISIVGIPLVSKNKVLGSLFLFYKDIHALSPWEENVIPSLGNQIGAAMELALLFAKNK